jgi:hypothetical protein
MAPCESKEELTAFVAVLLEYAKTHNKGISAQQISRFHRARAARNTEALDILYNELAALVFPVTVDTLYATDDTAAKVLDEALGDRKPDPTPRERTKRALRWTALITFSLLLLIIANNMLQRVMGVLDVTPEWFPRFNLDTLLILLGTFLDSTLPMIFGALGACAYLLIEGHMWVWNKTFSANLIQRDHIKLVIGALSGLIIIELIWPQTSTGGSGLGSVSVGKASLAFLAGYSTDFLFETIKRLIGTLLPRTEQTAAPRPAESPVQSVKNEKTLPTAEPGRKDTPIVQLEQNRKDAA